MDVSSRYPYPMSKQGPACAIDVGQSISDHQMKTYLLQIMNLAHSAGLVDIQTLYTIKFMGRHAAKTRVASQGRKTTTA